MIEGKKSTRSKICEWELQLVLQAPCLIESIFNLNNFCFVSHYTN